MQFSKYRARTYTTLGLSAPPLTIILICLLLFILGLVSACNTCTLGIGCSKSSEHDEESAGGGFSSGPSIRNDNDASAQTDGGVGKLSACQGVNTCNQATFEGALQTSLGTVPFDAVTASMYTGPGHCLSSVRLNFQRANQSSCSLKISAGDVMDQEGRILITDMSVSASGLCPGFPSGLSSSYYASSLVSSAKTTYGTIEVVSWQECSISYATCTDAELLVRPNGQLTNFRQVLNITSSEFRVHVIELASQIDQVCPVLLTTPAGSTDGGVNSG